MKTATRKSRKTSETVLDNRSTFNDGYHNAAWAVENGRDCAEHNFA